MHEGSLHVVKNTVHVALLGGGGGGGGGGSLVPRPLYWG